MIIDIHAHCFPDELAAKAIPFLEQKSGVTAYANGTIKGLKDSMTKAGVHTSVLQPVATKPNQTVSINRWAVSVQDESIISFGTIHPEYAGWKEEIKFLMGAGVKGIKFHPNHQEFFIDDPKIFPIYEKIFESGFIVLFHMGLDLWSMTGDRSTPERLVTILKAFPGATIIAAHMGGYRYWDDVEKYLIGTDLYLDTAYSFEELGTNRMERIIRQHGTDRILFATDSPWTNPAVEISHIWSLGLSEEEIKKILGGNARCLLCL
jgi:hypothetical protein